MSDDVTLDPYDGRTFVYSYGLVACSVCVPKNMERSEVERSTNSEIPTGSKLRWKIAEDTHFKTGEPNPTPCNLNPDSRLHYLLHC